MHKKPFLVCLKMITKNMKNTLDVIKIDSV